MAEEGQEPIQDKFKETEAQVRVLFGKLTELVLSSVRTRKDGADAIVAISSWSTLILASVLIMMEGSTEASKTSLVVAERITAVFNHELKTHIIMLRGMKRNGDNKIILPE